MNVSRRDGRALLFTLGRERFGIALGAIRGVFEPEVLRTVPGAPDEVPGVAAWRGRVLTVVDLARLLDLAPIDGPCCLARLASPLDSTALMLPRRLRVVQLDEEPVTLLDPPSLVRGLEAALERRS